MDWLAHWMGLDNGSGGIYLFWSGFFGDITIIAAAVVFWFKHTCHVHGCYRFSRHPVEGTPYVTCRKHHPDDHVSAQDVKDAHTRAHTPAPRRAPRKTAN